MHCGGAVLRSLFVPVQVQHVDHCYAYFQHRITVELQVVQLPCMYTQITHPGRRHAVPGFAVSYRVKL